MHKIADVIDRVHCCDTREFMKQMPDKCVDLVLTDPPYGRRITRKDNQFGSASDKSYRATGESWDDLPPSPEVFGEIFRVSRKQIIFGGNHFVLPVSEKWIVWDKTDGIAFDNPFSKCELAWTNMKGIVERYGFAQQGFVKDTKDKRYHPTQKPSELFAKIIDDWSGTNDIVFDPFLGSGTTAVACIAMGRHYIGCEISAEYCKIAEQRIQDEKDKYGLFNDKRR